MGFVDTAYQKVFRRTSTFALACIGTAFLFERGFDLITDHIFESHNRGKLWEHIKHKYEVAPADTEVVSYPTCEAEGGAVGQLASN